jgi:uncharacterized protein (DUF1697 family)
MVALLRGINVGGNKLLPMARLRALLERLGTTEVATLLQSGNAVFTCPERGAASVGRRLEAAIAEEFGFSVDVVTRTRDELAAALARIPLPGADENPSRFLIFFCREAPEPQRFAAIAALARPSEAVRARGREIYASFPDGAGRSKLATALMGPGLGVVATSRNLATTRKLLTLVG